MAYTLQAAIKNRRTIRDFTGETIEAAELETLAWSACGCTLIGDGDKYRTAPSAGATFPVEIYAIIERVNGYDNGFYKYDTEMEKLKLIKGGIYLPEIRKISWDQEFVSLSNAVFIMVYNPLKIEKEYGKKSRDYALLECGHIAQNILLTATSLGLGAVPVGAFSQKALADILGLKAHLKPLYMVCVGTIN
jgi:SagB-type dehydrogenase family enzyme